MRSRMLAAVLLLVAVVAIGLALSVSLSSPVCLTLARLEPSGVVDAAGKEFGLADIIVSNLTKGNAGV